MRDELFFKKEKICGTQYAAQVSRIHSLYSTKAM